MEAVCRDAETAPLTDADRALFRFLEKVNDHPAEVTQVDVDLAKAAGLGEEALFDGITVCAVFNFFNRWIDGTGVPATPDDYYRRHLEQHGDRGYAP